MSSVLISRGRPKTKIVCTLGPSTESKAVVRTLIENGMSVARLNLSHGTLESHSEAIALVREVSEELGIPVGIMVDVPGSKYRTAPTDPPVVELRQGDAVTLTSVEGTGSREVISVSPPGIHLDASVDGRILVDDGLVELVVTEVSGKDVRCKVVAGGRITARRGVTTPGVVPSMPLLGRDALTGLKFAADEQADFVAMSMVTKAEDVHEVRKVLEGHGLDAQIISKIERKQAICNFDGILEASDSIMVARGDMGVEVPLSRVPIIQKDLISKSNSAGKTVITATQMLESMVSSPVPTRAEVTDVANAIFDGTDAIMLSGETSIGQHPDEAVKVMAEVALEAEEALPYESIISEKTGELEQQTDDAISYDACRTAYQLSARLIVAFTESGATAARVSKYRPQPPILAPHVGPRRPASAYAAMGRNHEDHQQAGDRGGLLLHRTGAGDRGRLRRARQPDSPGCGGAHRRARRHQSDEGDRHRVAVGGAWPRYARPHSPSSGRESLSC